MKIATKENAVRFKGSCGHASVTSAMQAATRRKRGSSPWNARSTFLECVGMLIVIISMCFSSAGGQQTQGSITGLITDASGASVAGGSVQIVNEQTHFITPAVTNRAGAFSAAFLTPGTYDVKVDAKGFASSEQTSVVLVAGGEKEVDFKLKPAEANASVTVTSNQDMLETGGGQRWRPAFRPTSLRTPQILATTRSLWGHVLRQETTPRM